MVNVTFKAESWMQIQVDGKTEFEGTLPSGTVRTWQAEKQLVVVAGNAGGVMVAVNNGQPEQLGLYGACGRVFYAFGSNINTRVGKRCFPSITVTAGTNAN